MRDPLFKRQEMLPEHEDTCEITLRNIMRAVEFPQRKRH